MKASLKKCYNNFNMNLIKKIHSSHVDVGNLSVMLSTCNVVNLVKTLFDFRNFSMISFELIFLNIEMMMFWIEES